MLIAFIFGAFVIPLVVERAFQPTQVSIWLALADAGAVSGKIGS
jgi:hypothetical protein